MATADFQIQQHDLLPSFQTTLTVAGVALDLTNALSLKFYMRLTLASPLKVSGATAVIVTAASGIVRYDWAGTDTDTVGEFLGKFVVTWPGNKPQSAPTASYHTISIVADLGA